MDIEIRKNGNRWIAEVWSSPVYPRQIDEDTTYDEDTYVEMNDWCKLSFGYHARTAYHVFEFKKKKDLEWFILRWS